MLALVKSSGIDAPQPETAPIEVGSCGSAYDRIPGTGTRVELAAGDMLFCEDQPKRAIYRVDSGAVCLLRVPSSGRGATLGFAFAGDYVGLGALERHVWSAQASVATVLSRFPLETAACLIEAAPAARWRQDADTALEFAVLRDKLVAQGRQSIAVRLASLLLALSSLNQSEGRSGDVLSDDLSSGAAAELLGVDVAALEGALLQLSRLGCVRAEPHGTLRIVDRAGLERYAAAEVEADAAS